MLIDTYQNGYHVIVVYVPRVRYEIRDDRVWEVTAKGKREVSQEYAQREVAMWREREAKVVTVGPPTRRQIAYLLAGWLLITVTVVAAMIALLW